MYKNIAVLLLLLLIGGGAYSIVESGGINVIRNAYTNDPKTNTNPPSIENIVGLYSCTVRSGCNNKYLVLLKDDMTAEILLSSDSGIDTTVQQPEPVQQNNTSKELDTTTSSEAPDEEVSSSRTYLGSINDLSNIQPISDLKKGNWLLVRSNVIILTVTDNGDVKLDTPQKIIINKIDSNSLSRISYNKNEYKDMTKPVFLRENY